MEFRAHQGRAGRGYDTHEVQSAANARAAVANSGLPGLFRAATAEGNGWWGVVFSGKL